jgi:hypothetical protein
VKAAGDMRERAGGLQGARPGSILSAAL